MNPVTKKIKTLCTDRGISISELAESSGLTEEQINLIYSSDKIPSLASLIKISRALGVRLGTFLDDSEYFGPVINRGTDNQKAATFTSQLSTDNSHMDFYSLAARKAGRAMEPFLIDIVPGKNGEKVPSSHEGEEFIYVMNGSIKVNYGAETHLLNKGDSIYYDSIVDHLITAATSEPAQILAVVYSPF